MTKEQMMYLVVKYGFDKDIEFIPRKAKDYPYGKPKVFPRPQPSPQSHEVSPKKEDDPDYLSPLDPDEEAEIRARRQYAFKPKIAVPGSDADIEREFSESEEKKPIQC